MPQCEEPGFTCSPFCSAILLRSLDNPTPEIARARVLLAMQTKLRAKNAVWVLRMLTTPRGARNGCYQSRPDAASRQWERCLSDDQKWSQGHQRYGQEQLESAQHYLQWKCRAAFIARLALAPIFRGKRWATASTLAALLVLNKFRWTALFTTDPGVQSGGPTLSAIHLHRRKNVFGTIFDCLRINESKAVQKWTIKDSLALLGDSTDTNWLILVDFL